MNSRVDPISRQGRAPPRINILPQFLRRMRRYNMVAGLNGNFEEIYIIENVYFQGGKKFLKAQWSKFNHPGNFCLPIVKESGQQSQILQ